MRKLNGLIALLAAVVLTTSPAHARGYGRGGAVMSPDGVLYNTNSPEWRASGGDMAVYQQIMMQKQFMLQQQAILKYQQQMAKAKKQPGNPGAASNTNTNANINPFGNPPARKKKRRTYVPQGTTTSAPAKPGAAKPETKTDAPKPTAKP